MTFIASQAGKDMIKGFEGGPLLSAVDIGDGMWTIGWGHAISNKNTKPAPITLAQAQTYFDGDITIMQNALNADVTAPLNQYQVDALVSFIFNEGCGNFGGSTLLSKLNAKDYAGAANEFDKWVYSGGKVWQGLVNRRAAEKKLFLSSVYPGGASATTGGSLMKTFQTWLNSHYDSGLSEDGLYGNLTKTAATKAYQRVLDVTADGVFGSGSQAKVVALRNGSTGDAVSLMQGMLYGQGYNPNGFDGIFGKGCAAAVLKFQKKCGLAQDGVAGPLTMAQLYR